MPDGHAAPAGTAAQAGPFPHWPPGFRRRILLRPGRDRIDAALEDDAHCFRLRIEHRDGRITGVGGEALRHPWSACTGALARLVAELPGERLDAVAARDPREECTHLHDLAMLCAAHADDDRPLEVDMTVADRVAERTVAVLAEDGVVRLAWHLDGLAVVAGGDHAGRDLRALSRWRHELARREGERAAMLRRAVMVSGVRRLGRQPGGRAADQGPSRLGACYNYRLPQALDSVRMTDWVRDFSRSGRVPLADDIGAGEDA